MKKFEALERVQQRAERAEEAAGPRGEDDAAEPARDGAQPQLTEAQLQEVFKQTSVFTVRGATAHGERPPLSPGRVLLTPLPRPCSPDGMPEEDSYEEDEWCALPAERVFRLLAASRIALAGSKTTSASWDRTWRSTKRASQTRKRAGELRRVLEGHVRLAQVI